MQAQCDTILQLAKCNDQIFVVVNKVFNHVAPKHYASVFELLVIWRLFSRDNIYKECFPMTQ